MRKVSRACVAMVWRDCVGTITEFYNLETFGWVAPDAHSGAQAAASHAASSGGNDGATAAATRAW